MLIKAGKLFDPSGLKLISRVIGWSVQRLCKVRIAVIIFFVLFKPGFSVKGYTVNILGCADPVLL